MQGVQIVQMEEEGNCDLPYRDEVGHKNATLGTTTTLYNCSLILALAEMVRSMIFFSHLASVLNAS